MMAKGTTAALLRHLVSSGCTLRLFVNDAMPTADSTAASFVEPAHGYQPQPMMPSDWTVTVGIPCEAKAARTVFSFTSPAGVIRGQFLTRGKDLLWAERFKEDKLLVNQADTIETTPTLTAS